MVRMIVWNNARDSEEPWPSQSDIYQPKDILQITCDVLQDEGRVRWPAYGNAQQWDLQNLAEMDRWRYRIINSDELRHVFYSLRFWGGLSRHENSGASGLYVHSLENRDGANWIQGGELHRWTMSNVSTNVNTRDLGMWNDGPDYYFAFDVDCNQVVLNHS